MATSVADLLNTERNKSAGLISNSNSVTGILNQSNSAAIASAQSQQTNVEEIKRQQEEALAARHNAARVAFDTVAKQQTVLADELAAVNVRTAQTKEMEQVLRAEQNSKVSEVAQKTIEVNNTSFFRNPIQWFSTRSQLGDAKGDLQKTSEALVQVHNVIDDEYALASRNFRNFQSSKTMIAQRQSELDAKLLAEKESLDVTYAAQKAQADEKSLQTMATQLKVNPLALREAELKLEASYRDKANKADGKDVYGVEALGAAYNLNMADPRQRLQVAASFQNLTPEERHKWNSVQLALLASGKPLNSDSVLQEFKVRNDVEGYLKVVEASDPELHGELMRGVVMHSKAIGEQMTTGKNPMKLRDKLVEEITLANEGAEGSNKLTSQQIEGRVQQTLFQQALGGGINAVLSAGTTEVRQKLSAIGARAGQEVLDGNSIAQWAEQVDGLSPQVIEALKSPNTVLAYDTGHKVGNKLSAIDPQASRVVAGIEKLVAMGIKEEDAVKAYSGIMKKAAEGYLRAIPEGKYLMDRYKKYGIELPLVNEVASIDLGWSLFGGASLQKTDERKLDLFNPTDLQNLLARIQKQARFDEIRPMPQTTLGF